MMEDKSNKIRTLPTQSSPNLSSLNQQRKSSGKAKNLNIPLKKKRKKKRLQKCNTSPNLLEKPGNMI